MTSLAIEIGEQNYQIDVPDDLALEAGDFFDKMDKDMNCGWQMSRWWVPNPDETQPEFRGAVVPGIFPGGIQGPGGARHAQRVDEFSSFRHVGDLSFSPNPFR